MDRCEANQPRLPNPYNPVPRTLAFKMAYLHYRSRFPVSTVGCQNQYIDRREDSCDLTLSRVFAYQTPARQLSAHRINSNGYVPVRTTKR